MFNINDILPKLDTFAHLVLGDSVEIIQPNGDVTTIKAMFEWVVEEDDIAPNVDDVVAYLEEILNADQHLFSDWTDTFVRYRGKTYSISDFRPKHDRNFTARLRPKRVV